MTSSIPRLAAGEDTPAGPTEQLPLSTVLADDNRHFRRMVAQLLADHYADLLRVVAVCQAEDLVAVCARERPRLVLLDIGLPGMVNLTSIARLREEWGVAVIVLSLEDDGPYVQAAQAAGAEGLVGKGQVNGQLRAAVQRAFLLHPSRLLRSREGEAPLEPSSSTIQAEDRQ